MSSEDKHVYKEVFASILKQHRTALKITQEELAERAGIAVRYVGHLEAGKRQPSVSVFCHLAYALETTPALLMENYQNHLPKEALSFYPIH